MNLRGQRYKKQQLEEVTALWNEGMTAHDIAEALNRTVSSVYWMIKRAKEAGFELSEHDHKYSMEIVKEVVRLWNEEVHVSAIAKKVGLSSTATTHGVIARARRYGMDVNPRVGIQKEGLSERDDKIVSLWNEGFSSSKIGTRVGVTRNVVMGVVNRARNPTTPKKRRALPRPHQKDPIIKAAREISFAHGTVPRRERLTWEFKVPTPQREPIPDFSDDDIDCKRVEFLAIKSRECRWPLWNEADTHRECCGRHTELGKSYCKEHDARAWRGGVC